MCKDTNMYFAVTAVLLLSSAKTGGILVVARSKLLQQNCLLFHFCIINNHFLSDVKSCVQSDFCLNHLLNFVLCYHSISLRTFILDHVVTDQILRLPATVSCFLVNHPLHCFFFQGAVALQQRPPFHSTSLVLAVTGLLWLTSLGLHLPQLKKLTLACFVAWLSHHLRDAVRRGLWFPPFGSTPPLPYAAYIVATAVLSVAAHVVYSLCSFVSSDTSVGEDLEAGPLSTVLLQ